ncbi:MAG: methyltransferase domain-containing protein [Amaricoccus sp.]
MDSPNAAQAAFWTTQAGPSWVELDAELEAGSRAITDRLLAACAPRPGEAVLDVGCGAGGSTRALAAAVGPAGRVLGVDISAPLLARARERAAGVANVAFEQADAQDHAFAPAAFDLAASRFGMMFFADPVAAFRNIARALVPGGRLVFVAWAGPEHNPWFALPRQVAVARLGPVAPPPPDAPGPMAFRDADRVTGLLAAAGLIRARAEAVDTEMHQPGGVAGVLRIFARIGPVPGIVRERGGGEADQAAILRELGAVLARFEAADGVRIPARVIVYSAVRPA